MWNAIWLFCGIFPAVYIWIAPFNWLTFLLCWAIIFAWDYVNYRQTAEHES